MDKKSSTKLCKHCQSEIPKKAKVCPHCRKRVKGGFLKWFMIIFAVFIVLGAFSDSDPSNSQSVNTGTVSDSNVSSDVVTTTDAPLVSDYYVGDILMDGHTKIVFVASGEYIEENPYLQPVDGYKYIFLKFAFENTSTTADAYVSAFSFECYADGYAMEAYYGGEEALSATLSAGRATTGYVYFSIPKDAVDIEIEYTPNVFINDKLTFIYEGEADSGYVIQQNTTASDNAIKPGDIIEFGNLRVTYISCEEYNSENQFVQPADGYRYITCYFEFENIGNSDEFISCLEFDCYADGMSCTGIYSRDDALSATISGGRKARGTVTFEVPVDATVIEVEYLKNVWTSDRIVFSVS